MYEYAGFRYILSHDDTGKAITALPVSGQHPAANKEKHRKAACDTYNAERK